MAVTNDFGLAIEDEFLDPEIIGNCLAYDNAAMLACQHIRMDLLLKL